MRFYPILALAAFAIALVSIPAKAAPISSSTYSQDFSSQALNSNYTPIFVQGYVVKAVKGFTISSSAATPIVLAIGAATQEVDQLVIPAGNSVPFNAAPVFYPMTISQNQRISIHSSNGVISSGKFVMNLLYN